MNHEAAPITTRLAYMMRTETDAYMGEVKTMAKIPNKQPDSVEELEEILEGDEEETEEVDAPVRPNDLAKELGVDGKRVRAFLRDTFPRASEAKNTNWELTQEQVNAVVERFSPSDDEESEDSEDSE